MKFLLHKRSVSAVSSVILQWSIWRFTEYRLGEDDTLFLSPSGLIMYSCAVQVLIAAGSGSVMYSVDMEEAQEKPLSLHPPSPITSLRQSPCGGFIALFTADGRLVVMTSGKWMTISQLIHSTYSFGAYVVLGHALVMWQQGSAGFLVNSQKMLTSGRKHGILINTHGFQ